MTPFCPPRSIVVSCQPGAGSPLRGAQAMALLAQAAVAGGAAAIRANGAPDITAIRKAVVDIPILGINKVGDPRSVFITPTVGAAAEIVAAGADAIALDGTLRPRPDGSSLAEQIARIKQMLPVEIIADVDSLEAGVAARDAGADVVATTLSGYTGNGVPQGPDVELVARLVAAVDCPVIAEGRYWSTADVEAAFDAGAHAVVIGAAITNPMAITQRFVAVAA